MKSYCFQYDCPWPLSCEIPLSFLSFHINPVAFDQVSRTIACSLKHCLHLASKISHFTGLIPSFLTIPSWFADSSLSPILESPRISPSITSFFFLQNPWSHPWILPFTSTFKLPANPVSSNYKIYPEFIWFIPVSIFPSGWLYLFHDFKPSYMLSTPKLRVLICSPVLNSRLLQLVSCRF